MARYLRRLSLIADSFWIGGSFQREYTMGQPLNHLFQHDLAKCPVGESSLSLRSLDACSFGFPCMQMMIRAMMIKRLRMLLLLS